MKLFIFGSTGDLVKRKVLPALLALKNDKLEIIALGRKEYTDKSYEEFICGKDCFGDLNKRPKYHKISFENEIVCEKCYEFLDKDEINYFYIALPPKNLKIVLKYLGQIKKSGFKIKILSEKPFGASLKEAEELKKHIFALGLGQDFLISDHYLFKEGVLAIKNEDIQRFKEMKIVSLEEVGLENRIGYYDEIGALKDMVQSHFLNIVFDFLKNPGEEFKDFEVVKFVRAQYGDGKNKGYVKELGRASDTETFIELEIKTKTKKITFLTGKKFRKKEAFIQIDNEKIELKDKLNPYLKLFDAFFNQEIKNFPSIDNSILAWRIIDRIEKEKTKLNFYS